MTHAVQKVEKKKEVLKGFKKILRERKKLPSMQEVRDMISEGAHRGLFSQEQRFMLLAILEIGQISLREVMVPKVGIVAVEANATIEDIIYQFKMTGYSRLPVYDGTMDNIIGVVYVRDILRFIGEKKKDLRAVEFIRLPHFIPASKKVLDALREFRKNKISIAMVVDEFGSLLGLVTLDDLLEEIVGELQDEFTQEEKLYRQQDDGSFLVNPRLSLEELEKVFGVVTNEEDIKSVGGLLLSRFGRVPEKGEKVEIQGLSFEIAEATKQKIQRVIVRKI